MPARKKAKITYYESDEESIPDKPTHFIPNQIISPTQVLGNFDIWNEIHKYLSSTDILNLRLVSQKHLLFTQPAFSGITKKAFLLQFRRLAYDEDLDGMIEIYENCSDEDKKKLIERSGKFYFFFRLII